VPDSEKFIYELLLDEIKDSRQEQRQAHAALSKKIDVLEKDIVSLKTKATLWGSVAGFIAMAAFQFFDRIFKG